MGGSFRQSCSGVATTAGAGLVCSRERMFRRASALMVLSSMASSQATVTVSKPSLWIAEPVMNFMCGGHEMMIQKRSAHDRNEEAHNGKKYPDKIFPDERINPLLSQVQSKETESLLGESGLAGQLKKRLAERMLEAELSHHLKQQSAKGKPTITATAAARRPCSRLRVIDRWIFRETGFPRLSLRSLPKINGACLALRIM